MTALLLRDSERHGLTRSMLRTADWALLSRGLYGPAGTHLVLSKLCEALQLVLPPQAGFGHLTGARVRGWWLPELPDRLPMLATSRHDLHVQRSGVYVRRSPATRFESRYGLTLVSAPDTLLELARDLSLIDLVPIVDSAMRFDKCTADDILHAARPRVPGVRNLRRAVSLADPRSESRWESILRLLHVLSGISVQPQALIMEEGHALAYADLRITGTRRLAEYDGADHRGRSRHRRDLAREKMLSRLGLERFGYTASEIIGSPGMIVRDADNAKERHHDPRRLVVWSSEAARSTLTGSGRARLHRRLAKYAAASQRAGTS